MKDLIQKIKKITELEKIFEHPIFKKGQGPRIYRVK